MMILRDVDDSFDGYAIGGRSVSAWWKVNMALLLQLEFVNGSVVLNDAMNPAQAAAYHDT